MKKEVKMQVKDKFLKKYTSGSPLILKEALINVNKLNDEGMIVDLYSEKNIFLGKGYYGKQNKGYGWVLTTDENRSIDTTFFAEMIGAACDKKQSFFDNDETTGFRLFNGEGDGVGGLTIDYFNGYFLITWYSVGIYTFKDTIISAFHHVLNSKNIPVQGLYQKKRFDQKGKYVEGDDFISGNPAPEPLIIKENNIYFAIYLNDGPMVGVFLDQREVRKSLRDKYAKDKTVLNMFSYTGAFSVATALGGAKKTTSIDLANRSRAKTEEQFELNQISLENHEIIVEDVFNYFKYAGRKKLSYDIVILDPPSFARSKKHTFSVSKDYVELMKDAIAITEDNGIIVASTNYSGFDMTKFKQYIDIAFRESNRNYRIREVFSLPEDFTVNENYIEGDYLKVVFVQKLSS